MTDDDLAAFSKELLTIAAVFYERRDGLAPEAVMIYWAALRAYPIDDVLAAIQKHVSTPVACRFFPKPGDLIAQMCGTRTMQALKAWTTVESAIRKFGRYYSVIFESALTHLVIEDMGGWTRLCDVEGERELEFKRQEFLRRFEAVDPERSFPSLLLGLIDQCAARDGRTRQDAGTDR